MHRHANRILRGLAIVLALASLTPAAATAGRWGSSAGNPAAVATASEVSTGLGATAPAAAPTATPSEISTGLTGGPGTPSRASEQPTVHMPRGRCHQYCASVDQHLPRTHPGRPTSTTMRPRIVIADGDFNWSDAAIGFGAAWGLVLLGLGSLLLRRQAGIRQAREPA